MTDTSLLNDLIRGSTRNLTANSEIQTDSHEQPRVRTQIQVQPEARWHGSQWDLRAGGLKVGYPGRSAMP
jgi:hypothetical protein